MKLKHTWLSDAGLLERAGEGLTSLTVSSCWPCDSSISPKFAVLELPDGEASFSMVEFPIVTLKVLPLIAAFPSSRTW